METDMKTTNFSKSSHNTSLVLSLLGPFVSWSREEFHCCSSEPTDPQRS